MKNAIYLLFPYPVMICAENYQFTSSEKKYISELEMIDNTGNLMSKNDKILDSKELSNLKLFIDEQIFIFKKKLLQMKDANEIYITQSWVINSSPNQYHPKHKHPNSVNESNAGCRSFETAQGSLILFPSLLEHDVEKNKSDRVRTSISFNTYVRGVVGGRNKLTEVNIS
jgi:ectoine hydroxylase-related dioxygenase (phytanoyl-CoA dioxygenase family)